MKGQWQFYVQFSDEDITITSKRLERSNPELFHFRWSLVMKLNKDATALVDVKMGVSEITFVKEINDEEKNKIMNTVKPVYNPSV